jgi:hypothetical protein
MILLAVPQSDQEEVVEPAVTLPGFFVSLRLKASLE